MRHKGHGDTVLSAETAELTADRYERDRFRSGLEANTAGLLRGRLHELADGFEEGSDVAIMGFNLSFKFG